MISVFGLRGCDACRKTLKWFGERGFDVEFTDLREEAVDEATLRRWLDALGETRLLNRRSTTWRGLNEAERTRPPLALLSEYPTLVKRPVVDRAGVLSAGFEPAVWETP